MKRILSIFLTAVMMALPCAPLAGCSGSLLDTVLADLPIATDIAISVVTIASSGDAANVQQVTEYAGKVSADLKLLESLITQYKSNLAGAPAATIAQANAVLNDVQSNLAAIMTAVGVNDPKVTAAVAAAVGSVKLILGDVALLIQNSAPKAVSAQLFFGLGMPGVELLRNRISGEDTAGGGCATKAFRQDRPTDCQGLQPEDRERFSKGEGQPPPDSSVGYSNAMKMQLEILKPLAVCHSEQHDRRRREGVGEESR